MNIEDIDRVLKDLFGTSVQASPPDAWQVETQNSQILLLASEEQSWLRVLLPLMPATEAEPFYQQLLEANFDVTQEARYALHQNVLWVVFQHNRLSLTEADLRSALQRLLFLQQQGLTDPFNQFVEDRVRQIIRAAKLQGQSLELTLQTLDRFYQEGIMGDLDQGEQARQGVLGAWQYQLERLWDEVEP
ncbi:MAG: hypothetical protein SFW36_21650 [Leptolyngbyaceae cyanobacterium bins.59]|nr:hypothetical protein [Leptolyngbyaceae cyanobacterium bins.59]